MLNWLLLYSILMSVFLRAYYHGKVVVPGKERSVLKKAFLGYVRAVCWTFVTILGAAGGIPGPGYREWWLNYSTEHSMILWWVLVVPLTVGLYAVKEMTYYAMRRPGHYGMFEGPIPDVCKLNMRLPLFWNVLYWGWLVFCPFLPFFDCFVRIFLLHSTTSSVFPYV